jgi:hypothetical protein
MGGMKKAPAPPSTTSSKVLKLAAAGEPSLVDPPSPRKIKVVGCSVAELPVPSTPSTKHPCGVCGTDVWLSLLDDQQNAFIEAGSSTWCLDCALRRKPDLWEGALVTQHAMEAASTARLLVALPAKERPDA